MSGMNQIFDMHRVVLMTVFVFVCQSVSLIEKSSTHWLTNHARTDHNVNLCNLPHVFHSFYIAISYYWEALVSRQSGYKNVSETRHACIRVQMSTGFIKKAEHEVYKCPVRNWNQVLLSGE